jgi:hypothetical protein
MAYDVNDIYLGRPGVLAAATGGRGDAEVLDAQPMSDFEIRLRRMGGQARNAGDAVLEVLNPFTMKGGKISGVRPGKLAGAGTILALLAAANEINDPSESAGRNLAQAGGRGLGSVGGGLAGAAIGQTLIPIPGVGALVGAAIGGATGGELGYGLASMAADAFEGSPESRAIRNQQAIARAAAESEADRLRMLMPLQDQAAQAAIRNRGAMAQIENEQFMQQAVAQALLEQQRGGTQQAIAMTNAILGA